MATTWILIAHSIFAKILQVETGSEEIVEIKDFAHPQANKTVIDDFLLQQQKLKNKKPMLPSNDVAANIDAHERKVFAKELAHYLEVSLDLNKYKKLIIVSSRAMLGDLRIAFSNNVRKVVEHELDKDLLPLGLTNQELIKKVKNDLDLLHF